MHVAVQEPAHVFVNRRDFILVKDAEDNSRVGHARDLDVVQIVINAEAFFESRLERVDARAARMDQRAVDVEKQQALLCFCHTKNDEIRMTNDEGMTKVNSRMLSEPNTEIFVSKCAPFQILSFRFVFGVRHSCFVISL